MRRSRRVRKNSKNRSRFSLFSIVLLGFFLMIFYVWLKVQTNFVSAEIQQLKMKRNRLLVENEELKAEVARLSSFSRIREIAQKNLYLVFIPNEDIIEIEK
ncbi:MAG: cell division protein FtsL [bacterium]